MSGPPESTIDAMSVPAGGWTLVEAQARSLGRWRYYISILRAHRRGEAGRVDEFPLCIQPNGRIHELVKLPRDVARLSWVPPENWKLESPPISLRRVGWFERSWRMAYRVLRTWLRLSKEERKECGLSLAHAVLNLPAAYRIATGFRVRFWELPYPEWIAHFDTFTERDWMLIREHIARFPGHPRFTIVVASVGGRKESLDATLSSLRAQVYGHFDCAVITGEDDFPAPAAPATQRPAIAWIGNPALDAWLAECNAALGQEDRWLLLLRAGDVLPPQALYWFAWEAQTRPEATVIYSDDDGYDAQGQRIAHRMKPDWSPAHFYSTHYIGAAAVMRGIAVAAAGGLHSACCRHGNYDLLLRMSGAAGACFAHLPAVLLHRDILAPRQAWEAPDWCAAALQAHLERNGIGAEVTPTLPDARRVRYTLPEPPPLVSIIVPTRDAVGLLRGCVDSLLAKTVYPRYEIIVVDNRSADPEALRYLDDIAGRRTVRVVRYDRDFNFSAINNFAARLARGEALCLLNNDTEVISPDWLDEMVGHLLQPRVGAVGAKLLYPDGRIQHGGVTVGPGGCANHLHIELERTEPGYCGRAVIANELSAVTGACLLTHKRVYEELHGLNESRLKVAFNDVDYCLRLLQAGYRVIYTPHAELYHHESATRGMDMGVRKRLRARSEIRYMRRHWRERMRHDPYYNPNLSYRRPDFSLGESQRFRKPWL
jgi:GT2 family glycosyltransferase